jgi:adenylate kinase
MTKRVILITGTPCTGKTTIAKQLTAKLKALYINLTELATRENLTLGKDETRNSTIIDEAKMKQRLTKIIHNTDKQIIIIDGHYAANVVPKALATHIFVLRRNPTELKKLMKKTGFSEAKTSENLASEILDVCLIEALNTHEHEKICEIDLTGKTAGENTNEILETLQGTRKCRTGIVDWLGMLEKEGVLDDYLKI